MEWSIVMDFTDDVNRVTRSIGRDTDVGDRLVCATSNFYRFLTDEGILADALVSDTCSEWMNMMIRRISDQNQLKCGNLSAVTLKLGN